MDGTFPISVRVARRSVEAEDIVVLELVSTTGGQLPSFSAGAHVEVLIRPGLVRQYSLCNNPSERDRYVIGVLRDPDSRGGSIEMHRLAEGTEVRISSPRNHFQLAAHATRSLLFAGGIGVTPILCMAERLAAIGADFEMHYNARSPERCAFYRRITESGFFRRVHFHFDDGDPGQLLNIEAALGEATPGTNLYVCGPPGYIAFVIESAVARGFAAAQIHREFFKGDDTIAFAEGGVFDVRLASSGAVYQIPADRSVLDVLRENGVDLPSSCEQGVCGVCVTRVLEGTPEHRDHYLTESERETGDQFMPCCSRSKSPTLTIDI